MSFDRAEIAAGITADLEAIGTTEAAPPPPPETTAAPAVTETPEKAQPESPAPAAPAEGSSPAENVLALTDSALVVDPADGTQKTWGEIKAERLRQADYTRKTMALAEERRAFAEERARLQAEYQAAAAAAAVKSAAEGLPELPDDDPYAKHIKAIAEQNKAVLSAQQASQAYIQEQQMAAVRARLDADEIRASEAYKLDERERTIVGNELLRRMQVGDAVASYDVVAKEYHDWREAQKASIREEAVREYKSKHRVGSPAAAPAAPASGVAPETLRPGTRGFADAIREEIAAMMR